MQNHTTNYLPSDIKSTALRSIYYKVQKIISTRYEKDLSRAKDRDTKRAIVENFKREIRDTINYYVQLCG